MLFRVDVIVEIAIKPESLKGRWSFL